MLGFSHADLRPLNSSSSPFSAAIPPIALTIAGYDPSSGAGITADLLVFHAHGLFAASAITALTVQSTLGIVAVESISADLLRRTLEHLQIDLPPQGIKIGMLSNAEIVSSVAQYLQKVAPGANLNPNIPIVLDPVLRSSSGVYLLAPEALQTLRDSLLPLVDWITPNWQELALLSGKPVTSMPEAEAAATSLASSYPSLNQIVTGGDQTTPTDLIRLADSTLHHLPGERIETTATHGTGCAFSTAFLSNLILEKTALEAAKSAKHYVTEALRRSPQIGHGKGPLDLLWPLRQSH
jgi:hydroxymethylpyrimidine/phosphomethylpyrimidine kinase